MEEKSGKAVGWGLGAAARGCGGRDSGGVGMGDRLYRSHAYRRARSAISHIGLSLPSESRDHNGKEGNSRQVSSASDASQTELGLTGIYRSSGTFELRLTISNENLILRRTAASTHKPLFRDFGTCRGESLNIASHPH